MTLNWTNLAYLNLFHLFGYNHYLNLFHLTVPYCDTKIILSDWFFLSFQVMAHSSLLERLQQDQMVKRLVSICKIVNYGTF